jgi:hypothetical protein
MYSFREETERTEETASQQTKLASLDSLVRQSPCDVTIDAMMATIVN